jgi:hypothetical protein
VFSNQDVISGPCANAIEAIKESVTIKIDFFILGFDFMN